jgi:hypothetical protein
MPQRPSILAAASCAALAALAACSSGPTPAPSPFPAPASSSASLGDLLEWDLVLISDSSGWGVAERYAAHIQNDVGVTVRIHDFATPNLSAGRVLEALRGEAVSGSALGELRGIIPEAEVVVFLGSPEDSPSSSHPGDWRCVSTPYYANDCSLETFDAYRADLEAIYETIFALRGEDPVIVRGLEWYNPLLIPWIDSGVGDACTECWINLSTTVWAAAARFNVPVAPVYNAFNGPAFDEDPRALGLIGPDGMHTSDEGRQLIADVLRDLGYEPTVP